MTSLRLAYLTSEYPSPSNTFIRREVEALRARGVDVRTFSIRRPSSGARLSEKDVSSRALTEYVLPLSVWRITYAHIWAVGRNPVAYCRALFLAIKHAAPGLKERIWSCFYFVEAVVLARMLAQSGVTRLHNHFANASARVGVIAAKYLGIPWSMTLHGAADWVYPNGYLLSEKIALADLVVCVSHYTRSQAMWKTPAVQWCKFHVCYCGLDLDRFSANCLDNKLENNYRIVTVGRLSVEKAQIGLIDAVASLVHRGYDISLRIVGSGPMHDELSNRIECMDLAGNCTLVGQLTEDEVLEELRRADLFVLASLMEGLPVVLMEAMAMNVPVIAPGVAGIPELVQHGRTGRLFFPGDWNGLADQIMDWIQEVHLTAQMSDRALMLVRENHDIRKCSETLADIFMSAK